MIIILITMIAIMVSITIIIIIIISIILLLLSFSLVVVAVVIIIIMIFIIVTIFILSNVIIIIIMKTIIIFTIINFINEITRNQTLRHLPITWGLTLINSGNFTKDRSCELSLDRIMMEIVRRACDHLESLVIVPNSVYEAISVALEIIIKVEQNQRIWVIIPVNSNMYRLFSKELLSVVVMQVISSTNVATVCDQDFDCHTYHYLYYHHTLRYREIYFAQSAACYMHVSIGKYCCTNTKKKRYKHGNASNTEKDLVYGTRRVETKLTTEK